MFLTGERIRLKSLQNKPIAYYVRRVNLGIMHIRDVPIALQAEVSSQIEKIDVEWTERHAQDEVM